MKRKALETLDVRTRAAWRRWLRAHHASASEIWLIFHKRYTGRPSVAYDAAVEEALSVGWIDSLITRLDEARYARKFTPRKPNSRWSEANRRRYATLKARGLLTAAGRARPPTGRREAVPPLVVALPRYIERALRADGPAWTNFDRLPPSSRRHYILWIDSARRQETKDRRLREAVVMLAAGQKLGLK